jgi:glutamyl-tRNA synthetase
MNRRVRVRIAPSPTGEPHVGTAYVALFNLAFARKHGGDFILRIEDTDQDRSRRAWEEEIFAGLRWLGLDWDEGPDKGGPKGPYRQSERTEIYRRHTERLVEEGHAYRCFCTKERLDELRAIQKAQKLTPGYDRFCRDLAPDQIQAHLAAQEPFTIRMRMPLEGQTVFRDELRGDLTFDNAGVDDQILLKSDGFPTYHLANVVDDHLMEITHVIRAEEWISSTPKHVLLYQMFGWLPPTWVHLPLLRNADKSKISKRKNPVSLLDYRRRGLLPEAVINYLAMLGWTMPDGSEVFDLNQFIEAFTWERMSLGGPVFDLDKLTWLNGKYFREQIDESRLVRFLREELFSEAYLRTLVPLVRERMDKAEDFVPLTAYFFSGDAEYADEDLRPKGKSPKELVEVLKRYAEELDTKLDFSPSALEAWTRGFCEDNGWNSRDLFMPLRIAITGRKASPPLFDTMHALGRAMVRRRIRQAIGVAQRLAKSP